MDLAELQKIAQNSRSTREVGIALTIASGVLAIFLLVPIGRTPIVVEPSTDGMPSRAFANMSLDAEAAIVYDLALGKTFYVKNADAQLPLASLTKLLTVYSALTILPGETLITIPPEVGRLDGPRTLSAGQTFSLTDLARITLTASLNDGAEAIASAAAGREGRSKAEMLSAVAAALELSQTYAVNGNGLDVSVALSGGYGSARDVARLAGALVARAPDIASATTYESARAVSTNGTTVSVRNTNQAIATIPHLLLSKTGLTDLAGGNLALVFDAGIGHPIAVVILGSSQVARFTDGSVLVAATFAHFAGTNAP